MLKETWNKLSYKTKIITLIDVIQILMLILFRYFIYEKNIKDDISVDALEKTVIKYSPKINF